MPYDDLVRAATVAVVFVALYAGHMVGDHWTQTMHQAGCKSLDRDDQPSWVAHWNCGKHVLTYTATQVVLLALAGWWLNLPLRPGWLAVGLAVSAVTHYFADLRAPLRRLCELMGPGKIGFYRMAGNGLNGAYLLDQSWHIGWLFVAALVIAGP